MRSVFSCQDLDPESEYLPGVGKDVDSDVGGSGADRKLAGPDSTAVAFWGICDIKYDPRASLRERIRVLELGDGRSSRFSHHGRYIKEKFDSNYCMARAPIKRAVMTENKKFTHDMFVQEGFAHLRPPTAAYPRRYEPHLAHRILRDLDVKGNGAVVLKLCNRSRGAGVVVVTASELDDVLRKLLTPPLEDLADFLAERRTAALSLGEEQPLFEEQCLHWWSNECPLFVVERCCASIPVAKDEDSPERFDGTLRVAFALYRPKSVSKYQDEHQVKPFEIDWLGGYWKLPKTPVSDGASENLEDIHNRIVSSFNSVDKRTAPVPMEQLQEVYDALTPALPRIFSSGTISVQMIMNVYRQDELFCAFALARVAAAMRVDHLERALGLFDLARRKVKVPTETSAAFLPEMSVLSYIDRNVGVCSALLQKWEDANRSWRASLKTFPANATSHYLQGRYYQEVGQYDDAVDCLMKAILLDPDFKLPYQGLGNCHLLRRDYEEAMRACLACFKRHPDAPFAQYIAGQCIYHVLLEHYRYGVGDADAKILAEKASKALAQARRRMPEHWTNEDQVMLDYVQAEPSQRAKLPIQDVRVWKLHGFRP
ncbi:dnc [Symbiodinium sp. KB8]|nr:dnc [Symbiodinium sp. KB8]